MTDIVERLRGNYISSLDGSVREFKAWIPPISLEAADTIEQLQAELTLLRDETGVGNMVAEFEQLDVANVAFQATIKEQAAEIAKLNEELESEVLLMQSYRRQCSGLKHDKKVSDALIKVQVSEIERLKTIFIEAADYR